VLCLVPGSEGDGALVQLTLASQAGGPRGRVYLPYIGFRVTRPLQARPLAGARPAGPARVWRAGQAGRRQPLCLSGVAGWAAMRPGLRRRRLLWAGNFRAACARPDARTVSMAGVWRCRRGAVGHA